MCLRFMRIRFWAKKEFKKSYDGVRYANAIALLGLLLSGMADDDDALFGVVLADYFTNRVGIGV